MYDLKTFPQIWYEQPNKTVESIFPIRCVPCTCMLSAEMEKFKVVILVHEDETISLSSVEKGQKWDKTS